MSYERRFANAFAAYSGQPYCVPCGSGTAALTLALQALGIGPGDEVIVPGLTWVACASSVCHVGAVPVLADVDPETLCISPLSVEPLLSPRTAAVMMVHLYSSVAPVDDLRKLARKAGVYLIEDASQAHGAVIGGKRTGTFGDVSAFSMQQSKLLTAGEGGACLTADPALERRMQQLRADGRGTAGADGYDPYREIVPYGEVLGRNMCMSEFHAAILLDALNRLDVQNAYRHGNFVQLAHLLAQIPGVTPVAAGAADQRTYYKVCLRIADDLLEGTPIALIARALTAELSLPVEPVDAPLNDNPLYRPLYSPHIGRLPGASDLYDPRQFELPAATATARSCVTMPHWSLLGERSDLEDIVQAFEKVLARRDALATLDVRELKRSPFRHRP